MASVDSVTVTLYERPNCHLCEQAALALAPLTAELGARLERANVEADPALETAFGLAIPVVLVAGVEVTRAPVDVAAVRAAIVAARAGRTP